MSGETGASAPVADYAATILIIDDNRPLAENLCEILDDEGIAAVVADDGHGALTLLERGGFELVITDVRMPGMDGIELLKHIHDRWPELPVILMTAFSSDSKLGEAMAAGALDVVTKPIDIRYVIELVQRVGAANAPILLVEDDPDLRSTLAEALMNIAGAVPHQAGDLATARRLAAAVPLRAAIVDVRLPDGNGLEFGRELHKRFGDDLALVFISGYVSEVSADLRDLLRDGRISILDKPFSPEILLDLIRTALH